MKNKKTRKNGRLEKIFIKVLPFSEKTTKLLMVLISIINITFSVFIFSETINKTGQNNELTQLFQLRSGETFSD